MKRQWLALLFLVTLALLTWATFLALHLRADVPIGVPDEKSLHFYGCVRDDSWQMLACKLYDPETGQRYLVIRNGDRFVVENLK
jgi:hypothetical protein